MKSIYILSSLLVLALAHLASASPFSPSLPDEKKKADTVKHVNAPEAAKLLESDKAVIILDIRTPGEFKRGHIAKAQNVDYRSKDFEKQLKSLDPSKTYLIHCASGGRSTRSLELFKKLEFKSLYHLDGGIGAWKRAKLPLE